MCFTSFGLLYLIVVVRLQIDPGGNRLQVDFSLLLERVVFKRSEKHIYVPI